MTWTLSASGNKTVTAANTCTISNATPGVVTMPNALAAGDRVVFTTTGTLPTGLSPNVVYYVISAGLAANSFEVSATLGGSAINTSSAGSGTHTCSPEITLVTDTNNATFVGSFDATPMIGGDVMEFRAYSIELSGGVQLPAWKGTWSQQQINLSKKMPPIASDISLQLTLLEYANTYSATNTFTNGSANITLAGNPLVLDDVVQFSTTTSLPTNFAINTNYFVVSVGSPFTVSATRRGTAITAGSAGSGTQTTKRVGHTHDWKLLRI